MKPYYEDGSVTLYHGDCRDIVTVEWLHSARHCVVTDPPYPNNADHFTNQIGAARGVLRLIECEAVIFWSEIEQPPLAIPLVAMHVWHRANVNGRPWEAAYHFSPDGIKRRSEVFRHAVEFKDATGADYLGHPTQKPVALMQELIAKTGAAIVVDPFMGVGSTIRAAKNLGRKAIGIEIEERYCEIAAQRCAQEVLPLEAA